jgi:hypothetical protein
MRFRRQGDKQERRPVENTQAIKENIKGSTIARWAGNVMNKEGRRAEEKRALKTSLPTLVKGRE